MSEETNAALCFSNLDLFSGPNSTVLQIFMLIGSSYRPLHGWISLLICSYGVVTNLINIVVLTRPHMRTSINIVLCGIAICDIAKMASYFVFVTQFYLLHTLADVETKTYGWMCFIMFHALLSVIAHATSLWLGVTVALIRKIIVAQKAIYSTWLKPSKTRNITIYIAFCISLLSIPQILSYSVIFTPELMKYSGNLTNENLYTVGPSELGVEESCFLVRLAQWVQGLFYKAIPCCLLAVLITCLLLTLRNAQRRASQLFSNSCDFQRKAAKKRKADRTTALLVCILTVGFITEFPQAIVFLLAGIYQDVFSNLIPEIGELLDLLSLINSAVNFILYCTMSSRYRKTFWLVLMPAKIRRRLRFHFNLPRWVPGVNYEISETCVGHIGISSSANGNLLPPYQIKRDTSRISNDNFYSESNGIGIEPNRRLNSISVQFNLPTDNGYRESQQLLGQNSAATSNL